MRQLKYPYAFCDFGCSHVGNWGNHLVQPSDSGGTRVHALLQNGQENPYPQAVVSCLIFSTLLCYFSDQCFCIVWHGQVIVEKAEKSDIPDIDKKKWVLYLPLVFFCWQYEHLQC